MFLNPLNVDSGSSSMWMENSIASCFGLGWSHAFEINSMNWTWYVFFEMIQNYLLALKGTHSIEGLRDDSNVEMVLGSVQINRLNVTIGNDSLDFFFQPLAGHHDTFQKGLCFEPLSYWPQHAKAKVSTGYGLARLF